MKMSILGWTLPFNIFKVFSELKVFWHHRIKPYINSMIWITMPNQTVNLWTQNFIRFLTRSAQWLNRELSNKTKLNKSPWCLLSASQWPNPQTPSGERETGRAWRSGRTSARENPRGRGDRSPPDHSASDVHGHVHYLRELKEELSPHFCDPLCNS